LGRGSVKNQADGFKLGLERPPTGAVSFALGALLGVDALLMMGHPL